MCIDLPDDLPLPLTSGEPYWYWLGGRPALDLVNTLRERWWRRVECLVTPGDLGEWLVRAGLLADPAATRRAHLLRARRLREAIDGLVTAHLAGQPAPQAAVAEIDGLLAAATPVPALSAPGGVPALGERPPADPVTGALAAVALDAARMLGTAERDRVRVCASDTCSARFYDRSPAGRRRWCRMQACGNRDKARRHRRRARDSEERSTP